LSGSIESPGSSTSPLRSGRQAEAVVISRRLAAVSALFERVLDVFLSHPPVAADLSGIEPAATDLLRQPALTALEAPRNLSQ